MLQPGDRAPWFTAPTLDGNADFGFQAAAGRFVLMLFVDSAGAERNAAALRLLNEYRGLFDDARAAFFGVTGDPADAPAGRIAKVLPGIRWFLDYGRDIARQYRVTDGEGRYAPQWLLLDAHLRVIARTPLAGGANIMGYLAQRLAQPSEEGVAPVLIMPNIFEPALCRHLIELYEARGGAPSGFMREVNGVTTGIHDPKFKRRSDFLLDSEEQVRGIILARLRRSLLPEIKRAFQFEATRIERYLVACYDSEDQGFFRAHRDNTTAGTAHRRFACSINLNAEDYEGGDLRFPEFGSRTYRPPTGGAAVFSCSLLHEATPVTRGKRYAYLPFFYDEAAAQAREAAARSDKVSPHLANYRAGGTAPIE